MPCALKRIKCLPQMHSRKRLPTMCVTSSKTVCASATASSTLTNPRCFDRIIKIKPIFTLNDRQPWISTPHNMNALVRSYRWLRSVQKAPYYRCPCCSKLHPPIENRGFSIAVVLFFVVKQYDYATFVLNDTKRTNVLTSRRGHSNL